MEKQVTTTYTAYKASIHFCTNDAEIMITDHSASETLVVEGLDQITLHGAINCYVHNVSLRQDKEFFLSWLKTLKEQVNRSIKTLEK